MPCKFFMILFFVMTFSVNASEAKQGYATVSLDGQLGNQLFQIATAYAYALDHNLAFTIPDLVHKKREGIAYNAEKLFLSKIDCYDVPYSPSLKWREPSFNYSKIPESTSIELFGYFQSEKYFKHRRQEILELFAPPPRLKEKIVSKYPFLLSDVLVVGVQIRDYRQERPFGDYHPTLDRDYYQRTMKMFPENAIFLVSSNNRDHAYSCTEGLAKNIVYLQGEDYIEEFYTLSLCKSFIISNSSFGWWASWLCTHPKKTVLAPDYWFSLPYDCESMRRDLLPPEYKVIKVK